jgi:3-oxoacyl-[acyl-carrier-protein] synthase II (EC 2.3.1.41)
MAGTSRRVVVTGMGALTPLGLSVEEYWRGLVEGESGAARSSPSIRRAFG